ncbi:hypothetical protein ACFX2I_005227 [Malus domestica]
MSRCWKAYQQYKIAAGSATVIQSYIRGCFSRKGAENHRLLIVAIQRYFRGWLIRSQFSCQRQAAIKIQSSIRGLIWRQSFHRHRQAAVEIQRIVRGQISRNRLLGAASLCPIVRNGCPLNSTGALYMGAELNKAYRVFDATLKEEAFMEAGVSREMKPEYIPVTLGKDDIPDICMNIYRVSGIMHMSEMSSFSGHDSHDKA